MVNPAEIFKAEKHGFDVWPDVVRYAEAGTPMARIDTADLERMKWHGFFYRKRDEPGRYMNRIRVTANEMTTAQARAIALIAYEHGHGIVDITTRANLQVQGMEIRHLPIVAERLAAVGLTSKQTGHDNIRNVFAHPFSGVLADELIDTRALCRQVTSLFLGSRVYADLPRKFNICLNGAAEHSLHFWTQDLSFLACRVEDEVLFQVLVAGTQGQNPHLAWHLPVLVRPDQVVSVTGALLDLFRAQGSREKRHQARLRYLVERIGVDGVLTHLAEHVSLRPWPAGRSTPAPASQYDDLIGWFRQPGGTGWTMGLSVPLGRLSWTQLESVAVLAGRWGDGQLRTTHEQGLAVINIPDGFRDAAATDAAAVGLSVHADTLARNTMACTGTQFCNIAVTETKGTMFRLIETLRQRTLALHGIRIHMSGCPSSCAQTYTGDIGLKGVRVRRLIGTREGYDVYLGGGLAGDIHLGLRYKLGVDVDQLPLVIEEVVQEYYLRHRPGQTFSAYWRERLREVEAAKLGEHDYRPATWLCERCEYRHLGEDPPVFCPGCAGVRRLFARVDDDPDRPGMPSGRDEPVRDDGFVFAAAEDAVQEGTAISVEVGGQTYALVRVDGTVHAIDGLCPHEGGPLAEGAVANGAVTCPWHGWRFDARTGCGIEPRGSNVERHDTLVENSRIYLRPGSAGIGRETRPAARATESERTCPAVTAMLTVTRVIEETPDVRTFRLDNAAGQIPHRFPGRFAQVSVPIGGVETSRSFTVSSSPTDAAYLDLTIKRNPTGQVTNHFFEHVGRGTALTIRGTQGAFFFDPVRHVEPLVLISAGSGITPVMSIARFLASTDPTRACTFIHGARSTADTIFWSECQHLHDTLPRFTYHLTLSQPGPEWAGGRGRLDAARLSTCVPDAAHRRVFLCGPLAFMTMVRSWLADVGVPAERIHTEQFHPMEASALGG